MSRVLLVTEATRTIGEFRRPWVRWLYRAVRVPLPRRGGAGRRAPLA